MIIALILFCCLLIATPLWVLGHQFLSVIAVLVAFASLVRILRRIERSQKPPLDERVFSLLADEGPLSASQIAELLDVTVAEVQATLRELRDQEYVALHLEPKTALTYGCSDNDAPWDVCVQASA